MKLYVHFRCEVLFIEIVSVYNSDSPKGSIFRRIT